MEKEVNYIQKTSGLKKIDYFGYAMGDVASLLVFGLVIVFFKFIILTI